MKKCKSYPPFTIDDNNLIVYLPRSEYDFIESLGNQNFKDGRNVLGLIKMYSIIWCHTKLNPKATFVPIHSEVFRNCISAIAFKQYRELLVKNQVIDYQDEKIDTYEDVKGRKHIYCKSPMRYRLTLMSYQYSHGIYFKQNSGQIPVKIKLSSTVAISIKTKAKMVQKVYNAETQQDKIDNLLNISEDEIHVTQLVIKLIKDVYEERVTTDSRFDRRIREIAKHYRPGEGISLKEKEYILSILVYKVLISLYEIKKNKRENKIEHIASHYLSNPIDNQLVKWQIKRRRTNGKLSYYSDLTVEYNALDYCYQLTDLYHIARINEVPKFNYPDKKLYSKLANIRRNLRQFVRYKDSRLIEVSDIRSAHFTMLPLIFKKSGVSVSNSEMIRFRTTTQTKDLYSEVVYNTQFTRDEIKSVFQPFFSIRNEKSFIYAAKDEDKAKRTLICEYFKQTFPEIYDGLIHFHCNHDYTIKSKANEIESDIMNNVCDNLRLSGLHPFRVHDAIYLPDNEQQLLQFDINQVVYDQINEQNLPVAINPYLLIKTPQIPQMI